MKIHFLCLLIVEGIFVFVSCKSAPFDNSQGLSYIAGKVQNEVARQFFFLMERQEDSYERFKERLGTRNPLFEYADMGTSSDFGLFYIIPYQDDTDSINGCIIYPVDEEIREMERRSFLGKLGNPIDLDFDYLENEIPVTRRFLYSSYFLRWKQIGLNSSTRMNLFAQGLLEHNLYVPNSELDIDKWSAKTRSLAYGANDVYVHIYYNTGRYSGPQTGVVYGLSVETLKNITRTNFLKSFGCVASFKVEHVGYCELEVVFSVTDRDILKYGMGDFYIDKAIKGIVYDCCQMFYLDATMQYTYRIPTFISSDNTPPFVTGGTYIPPSKPSLNVDDGPEVPNFVEDCSNNMAMIKNDILNILDSFGLARKDSVYNKSDFQSFLNSVYNDSVEYSSSYQQYQNVDESVEHVLTTSIRGGKYDVRNEVTPSTIATIHNHINASPPSLRDVLFTAGCAKDSIYIKYKGTFVYSVVDSVYYALYITNRKKAASFYDTHIKELDESTNGFKRKGKFDLFLQKKGLYRSDMLGALIAILKIFDSGIQLFVVDKNFATVTSYDAEKKYTSKGRERKYLRLTYCKER